MLETIDNEVELWIYCKSEKENASLGFGLEFDPEKDKNWREETDWIYEGISDSFMENFEEFYPGIQKAALCVKEDPSLTFRQALFKVFGHIRTVFEIDGKETDQIVYNIDFEDAIYSLLEDRCLYWIE